MSDYAILGLGCVAVDTLIHVEQFPAEDSKSPIAEQSSLIGGTTATSILAAAALGARCAFAGPLGDDPLSRLVLDEFRHAGIDVSLVRRDSAARPIRCSVIVSRASGSRTVLYDLAGAVPAAAGWPPEESIRAARLLLVDQFGLEGIVPAARIARAAGIPVVAKLEQCADPNDYVPLLEIADHVVLPIQAALQITRQATSTAAIDQLWCDSHRALIVTGGQEGLWFRSSDYQTVRHLPAFAVPARDTTGCGDTFRGTYAAGLVRGLSIEEALVQGAAAAAIRASATMPTERLPRLEAIRQFIAARRADAVSYGPMNLTDLKWSDVAPLSRDVPIVIPIAALEQHGRHMPVFTDSMLLGEVIRRVSETLQDKVLVTPLMWLGNSEHHLDFPGTMSAAPRVYLDLLRDMAENFLFHGFKRIVFVNGHGGNIVPAQQAVFELRQKYRSSNDLLLLSTTYWTLGGKPWEADSTMIQRKMGHACEFETSMMLRINPHLVGGDVKQLKDVDWGNPFEPASRGWITKDRTEPGHIGFPRHATAEKGEILFRTFCADVVALLERVLQWDGKSWDG